MKANRVLITFMFIAVTILSGCEPLTVLNPKGPQAETIADVIWLSIFTMAFVVLVVFALYIFYVVQAARRPDDYEPPYVKDNHVVEAVIVGIPVLIIMFLTVVTVKSLYEVEASPAEYEEQEPLVIYAASSNWKWHFSYPEENIETVNYLFIPTDRPIEFKLYSYGPISSFWIPQLAGQKYAMAHAVNTLYLAADVPGEYMGRNANFTGAGFAEQTFSVQALPPEEYEKWLREIKATADPLTPEKLEELLEPGHLGQLTFTGTRLEFLPPPGTHQSDKADTSEVSAVNFKAIKENATDTARMNENQ